MVHTSLPNHNQLVSIMCVSACAIVSWFGGCCHAFVMSCYHSVQLHIHSCAHASALTDLWWGWRWSILTNMVVQPHCATLPTHTATWICCVATHHHTPRHPPHTHAPPHTTTTHTASIHTHTPCNTRLCCVGQSTTHNCTHRIHTLVIHIKSVMRACWCEPLRDFTCCTYVCCTVLLIKLCVIYMWFTYDSL